jgi:hypothetical protein
MRNFINGTFRAHDQAEATRRRMLDECRAGAGQRAGSPRLLQWTRAAGVPPAHHCGRGPPAGRRGNAEDHQKDGR